MVSQCYRRVKPKTRISTPFVGKLCIQSTCASTLSIVDIHQSSTHDSEDSARHSITRVRRELNEKGIKNQQFMTEPKTPIPKVSLKKKPADKRA